MKNPHTTQLRTQPHQAPSESPSAVSCLRLFLLLTAFLLSATVVQAASQTWTNTPADATWANTNNWGGLAAPGALNQTGNTINNDTATFNSPLSGTIGGAANPIVPDDATVLNARSRAVGSIIFDTANVGAYVFYSPSPAILPTVSNPETGFLNLCHNGSVTINAAVTNSQTFLIPIRIRLPSSTAGIYNFVNNATDPSVTLTITTATNDSATSRSTIFVLGGSNTGTNSVGLLSRGTTTSATAPQGVRKQGTGTWILTGANDFLAGSGASMNINEGTLIVKNPAAFGASASAIVNSNGVLQIDGVILNQAFLRLQGGTIKANGSTTISNLVMGTAAGINASLATTSSGDVVTVLTNSGGTLDTVVHVNGPGTVLLSGSGSYAGNWSFDAGSCQVSQAAALGTGPTAAITPGGSIDFSPLGAVTTAWTPQALTASGTGSTVGSTAAELKAAVGGTIDLATGGKNINLTFTPTAFSGDSTHPSLYVSQGTLQLGGNSFVINNASGTPLGVGSYRLIQQASGSILSGGGYVADVQGNGTAAGTLGTIQVSGGDVNLVVAPYTAKSLVWQGGNPNSNWDNSATANFLDGVTLSVFNVSDAVTFNSVGSANSSVNLVGTLSPGGLTIDTSANNYTFTGAGKIGGTSGLTNGGSGTLLIQTTNTYTGDTVISSGTVQLGGDNVIPGSAVAGDLALGASGVLDMNGFSDTVGSLGGSGTVDNTSATASTLTVGNNNGSGTFSGVIQDTAGALGLTKAGTGTQVISGANSYTGATIVNNGTLRLGNVNAVSSSSGLAVNNSSTLDVASALVVSNLTGVDGSFIVNNTTATTNQLTISGTSTYAGVIGDGTGGGGISVYVPSGTLRLDGANTYSGGTIVASGATMAFGVRNPGGSGTAGAGGIIASNGVTFSLPTALSTASAVPNAITTVDGATVTFTAAQAANSYNGQFLGSATATNIFFGSGTAFPSIGGALSFANFFGTVIVTNGSVRFFNAQGGGDNATFLLLNGNIFSRDASAIFLGALAGNGNITGPSVTPFSTYNIGGKGLSTTYSGLITGSNNIAKIGAGTLTVNGGTNEVIDLDPLGNQITNYFLVSGLAHLGSTTVSNGTLKLVAPCNLNGTNTSAIIMAGTGAILDLSTAGYSPDGTNLVADSSLVLSVNTNAVGQTLSGIGSITGSLVANVGTTVSPGLPTGTLNISGSAQLNGAVTMAVSATNTPNSSQLAAASFTVNASAALTVTNLGPEASATFQLFNHPVSFTTVNLPALTGTNSWQNNLAVNGSITLVAPPFVPPPTVNTNPVPITFTLSNGTNLSLAWPPDHLGWQLEGQTNAPAGQGLSTNWVIVPGSISTTQMSFTIDKTNGSVFFRMVYP